MILLVKRETDLLKIKINYRLFRNYLLYYTYCNYTVVTIELTN